MRATIRRRGTIAPFVIFALTTMLGFFALAVNKSWLWSIREDLRTATDAAALAAAQELVCDDMLSGQLDRLPAVLERATVAAATYAAYNTVRSRPLELRENLSQPKAGDVLFGVLTTPRAGDFVSVGSRVVAHSDQARINTIVITGRQTQKRGTAPGLVFGVLFARPYADVMALSGVTLDRGIRGIRPRNEPTPLAPLALYSDPNGQNPKSWEFAVEARSGSMQYRIDAKTGQTFADSNGNGIHEFAASLPTATEQVAAANVAVMNLTSDTNADVAARLIGGITADDLAPMGGRFVLPAEAGEVVNGRNLGPASGTIDAQALYQALEGLRQSAKVRIWPLYTQATGEAVTVSGFVAARVVCVAVPQPNQALQFTLKPTMIYRNDLVTDTDLRGRAATMNGNPYLCKIRRIE